MPLCDPPHRRSRPAPGPVAATSPAPKSAVQALDQATQTPARTRQRRSLQAGKSPSGSGNPYRHGHALLKVSLLVKGCASTMTSFFPPCCRNSTTAAGRGRPRSPGELCRSSHWPKVCVRTRIGRRTARHRHSVPRRQTGVRSRCYDLRSGGQPHSRLAVWLQPMPCRFAIRHTADPVQRPVL